MPNPSHRPATFKIGIRWLLLFVLLLAGCKADQATKIWARSEFQDAPAMTLVPDLLEFRYAENRAIAFSMLHQLPDHVRTPLIYGLSGLGMSALLFMLWKSRRQGLMQLLPFALILAGAVGNLQDRLTHGFVIDFIHVHWETAWSFPIFNVADSLVTIGGALFLLQSFWRPEPSAGTREPDPTPREANPA